MKFEEAWKIMEDIQFSDFLDIPEEYREAHELAYKRAESCYLFMRDHFDYNLNHPKKGWVRDTKEFYNTAIAVADNSCFGGLYIYLFLSQLVPPEEWPEGQVVSSERLTLAHCKAYTYKTRMANLKEEEEAKVLMN